MGCIVLATLPKIKKKDEAFLLKSGKVNDVLSCMITKHKEFLIPLICSIRIKKGNCELFLKKKMNF